MRPSLHHAAFSAAFSVVLASTPSAHAYPMPNMTSCGAGYRVVDYYFGTGFTPTQESMIRAGFEEWNQARSLGQQVADVHEDGAGAPGREIFVIPGYFADSNGQVNNSCNQITMNQDRTGEALRDAARHEMGHVLGLGHTGQTASYTGNGVSALPPTMAPCQTPSSGDREYTQDDEAQLVFHHAPANGYRRLHANPEMDRNTTYFTVENGGTLQNSVPGRVAFTPTSTNYSNMFQIVTYALPDGVRRIRATASYAAAVPGSSGAVTVQLVVRQVGFATASGGCAEGTFGDDLDMNDVDYVGPWALPVQGRVCQVVHGQVLPCPTSFWTVPDSYHAVHVKVRVFSAVKDVAGNLVPVYIHALTGEED